MLQLYDVNKIKVQVLTEYKDYKIESVLDSGDKTLSFSYPSILSNSILEECYIRNETDEFVIKEIKDDGKWKSVVAVMNVEELEGQAWEHFDLLNIGVKECLTLIVAGTGWKVGISDNISKKRTVKKTNCSSWDLIQEVKKSYRVEIEFDTLNKTIKVYEKIGSNKGSYIIDTLNLKKLELETDSYDYYTKIIAIGKSDIKVEVENYQYSNKVKTLIWKDEKYTDVDSLREDAILKLNEISKPRKSYRASIIDLARLSDKYKNILDYKLGDVVILISKDLKVKDKQRIVKITEYPDDPSKNDCEMSNTTLSFKELQKEFKDTSSTVNNITEDNGKISEKAIKEAVDKITIDKVDTKSLNAVSARIGELDVNKLNSNEAKIKFAEIDNALITKLETKDLVANNIKFNVASGDTLDLQTLLSKFVTGENGQFLNITSNNITIADAVIKDAMIDTISAAKINTGVLNTNLVNIQGNNGNLLIKDNTIQIKDGNKTRVQIGKDASDDYNMYVWDATGKLMFDATGLKADGIKNQIIRNDMISDNANINGKKIDINSLVTEVNKDSNTTLMKASKVALDTTGQSLEVSFNLLKTSSDDTKKKTESNTTEIGVINGQIDTLIKDTTIDEDGFTIKLKDSYSSLKQTVSGLNSTVASHSTSITNLGTSVTNAQNTANTANSLADSKAKIFTSTPNTPYKVGDMWTSGPSGEIMKCKVSRTSGAYTASDWEKASKYTDDTKANAVEGSLNTLSSKVTTVESKQSTLEQNLDGFKQTVSNTYSTKTELNNLQIGNKNILKQSGVPVTSTTYLVKTYNVWVDLKPSAKYTIVFKGSVNSSNKIGMWFNGGMVIAKIFDRLSDGSIYYTTVTTPTEMKTQYISFYNYPSTTATSCTIEWVCLYEGDIKPPMNWTPATEDIDQAISTVDSKVTTLNTTVSTVSNKIATIETNLTSITSRVSATESSITTINGNVTSLNTRMSTAEQKITDSAIIATVSSTINTAKEEAINSANSATDTKLQSYSTKASMELTASQLRLEFKSTGGNNIIKNSQFKNRIAFWNIHSGTGGAFVVAEDYINRGYQYGFRSSDTKEILFYQDVAVKGNVTYSISADVMAQQNTLGATLIVQFLASNGSITSTTNLETVVQNTNKRVVATVVTPANCTSIRLHIRHNGYTNLAYSFIFISNIMINQGYPVPWQPNSDEIIDGNTVVDGNGIEVTFDNGQGKARMGREGFYWQKDGLSKAYHCLFYKGEVFTDANVQNGVLIQLPAEFRGKDFEVIVAPKNIKKEGGFLMYWLNCYYSERNISNGTFKVHGVVDWRAVDNHNMISSTGINITYVVLA